ncbi:unnamed protein product, partial [Rotaria sp. Silwood1]
MSNKDDESIEMLYSKSCLDLNMDMETKLDTWRSYEHIRKHYVLEGDQLHCCCLNYLCSNDGSIIDKLCMVYCCSSDMCRLIIEQHLKNDLFKRLDKKKKIFFLNEFNYLETIRDINRQYDEIVLTNCIIDERIFLENKFQLNDLCNSLNENQYSKSSQNLTSSTANQHITSNGYETISFNQYLTFISQANQLIKLLYSIV